MSRSPALPIISKKSFRIRNTGLGSVNVKCSIISLTNPFLIAELFAPNRRFLSFSSIAPQEMGYGQQYQQEAILFHVTDGGNFFDRDKTEDSCHLVHVSCSLDRGLHVRLSEKFIWEPNSSEVCKAITPKYGFGTVPVPTSNYLHCHFLCDPYCHTYLHSWASLL